MTEFLKRFAALDAALESTHGYYIAGDIMTRIQFFPDKRINNIIYASGCYESDALVRRLEKAFGENETVRVFSNGGEKLIATKELRGETPPYVLLYYGKKVEECGRFDFSDLVEIMDRLRAPDGCEWDKAQTHESIRINLIEEAYELVEAIDAKDKSMLLEEVGDVLLQAVFHTHIELDSGGFDYHDVLSELCHKLISRHNHIFGQNKASNPDEALNIWNEAKKKEKGYESYFDAMNRVPKNLPALLYAYKIQKSAKKCGFDFADPFEAFLKLKEEMDEVLTAPNEKLSEECGDLLFAAVNVLRILKVEPEMALRAASEKFMRRFKAMEEHLTKDGGELTDFTLDEINKAWEEAKGMDK